MSTIDPIDPAGGVYVKGLDLTAATQSFVGITTFNQLRTFTRHPQDLQPGARRTGYDADELAEEAEVHELIQRALSGNKKKNVANYADYITAVVNKRRDGVLPPIHLWSREELAREEGQRGSYLVIPYGRYLLSIDGETQLTAHFEAQRAAQSAEEREAHGKFPLVVVIHHGVSVEIARQYFHDLNVLSIRPNVSVGLSMDSADPVMRVANHLEAELPTLRNRVERLRRQLPKDSPKIMTTQTLRQMVINVAKGISGVQYGARPAPMDDVDLEDLQRVAARWIGTYLDSFGAEVVDREESLAGSPAVLAAVGALGQLVLQAPRHERDAMVDRLIATLHDVDWRKGDHWVGIAGAYKTKGFSVNGPKEAGYNVHAALIASDTEAFRRVRHLQPSRGDDAGRPAQESVGETRSAEPDAFPFRSNV